MFNIAGYYDQMAAMLQTTIDEGFMKEACAGLFRYFDRPDYLLDYLEGYDETVLDVRHLKNI